MKITQLKWFKPTERKPKVDKGSYRSSIKVLVKWVWRKSKGTPQISIGYHIPGTNMWRMQDAHGDIQALRWAHITYPGKLIPKTKKPKVKKSRKNY